MPRETGGIPQISPRRPSWDNVFIERLWRSMKHECVCLRAFETGQRLHAGLSRYIRHSNFTRPHSSLAGRTPDEVYHQIEPVTAGEKNPLRNWSPDWRHNQSRE